mmetsp:Transcript_119951/g.382946  ORF Transcript_119951/g.382946 Transcript_119951/m.382946 type:complete len:271 (+) Transcript_119951:3344-4156(+)
MTSFFGLAFGTSAPFKASLLAPPSGDLPSPSASVLFTDRAFAFEPRRCNLINFFDHTSPTRVEASSTSAAEMVRPQTRVEPRFVCLRSHVSKCLALAAARVTWGGPVTCKMHSASAAPGRSPAESVVLAHTSSATLPAKPLGVLPARRCLGRPGCIRLRAAGGASSTSASSPMATSFGCSFGCSFSFSISTTPAAAARTAEAAKLCDRWGATFGGVLAAKRMQPLDFTGDPNEPSAASAAPPTSMLVATDAIFTPPPSVLALSPSAPTAP